MTDPLPVAEIIHAMPGRARLRITSRRGNSAFLTTLAAGLSAHPGVTRVDVAALTGSVLIRHLAPLAEICATAEKAGLFRLGAAEAGAPPPPLELPKFSVEPKLALAAGLGMAALWQLGNGNALPPALTLIWYASRLAGLGVSGGALDEAE
jgi:hypothetical protein